MTTLQHYETLLADCYDWMQGGWLARRAANRIFFEEHNLSGPGLAIDLGAGTGYQSIPLAERGFDVVAFDLSAKMLSEVKARSGGLSVRCVEEDMFGFSRHVEGSPRLIVCMGDSLPHLSSITKAEALLQEAAESLAAGGHLVLQFRGLARLPDGDARFLPVRSDADRIFTCFLEEVDENCVRVHDLLHLRKDDGFKQTISSYLKVRLDTTWLNSTLTHLGLSTVHASEARGMITRIARKAG